MKNLEHIAKERVNMTKFNISFVPYLLPTICYLLFLSGCATAPALTTRPAPTGPGIYHKVERGQTLWRISRAYGASLDEIARVNHISDAASIEIGQMIFIPEAKKTLVLASAGSEDFIWPLKGKVISGFGQKSDNMVNKGLNIRANPAAKVVSSRGGRVVFYSPDFKGYGKTVIIDHGDGFSTVYSGSSEVFVKPGDTLAQGAAIADTRGATLHFQIRKGHISQNPYFYLQ